MKNLIFVLVTLSSVSAFAGAGGAALSCKDSKGSVFVSVVDDAWGVRSTTKGFGGGADRELDFRFDIPEGPKNKSVTPSILADSGVVSAVAVQGPVVVHILASGIKSVTGHSTTYSNGMAVSTGDYDQITKTGLICTLENE